MNRKTTDDIPIETTVIVMTHALKTPLTTIKAHAQLSLRAIMEDRSLTTQPMEHIIRNVDRMSSMLDAISLSTKLHSSSFTPELKKLNLSDVVQRTIASVQKMWKRIIIFKNAGPAIDWLGDETLVSSMLVQVLVNAIMYSPEDTDVVVELSATQESTRISITDKGSGILASQLQQMEQSNFSPMVSQTGLGIGLHLCHEILTIYNGTISIVSKVNEGTTVTVLLPHHAVK